MTSTTAARGRARWALVVAEFIGIVACSDGWVPGAIDRGPGNIGYATEGRSRLALARATSLRQVSTPSGLGVFVVLVLCVVLASPATQRGAQLGDAAGVLCLLRDSMAFVGRRRVVARAARTDPPADGRPATATAASDDMRRLMCLVRQMRPRDPTRVRHRWAGSRRGRSDPGLLQPSCQCWRRGGESRRGGPWPSSPAR